MIAKGQQKGTLYVVATPIGNMNDITLRAIEILRQVDLIAAEDTRHTRKLLTHHHINGQQISYHGHNESERALQLIEKLNIGSAVALVCNAGTPLVSDPGYRLVQAAIAQDIAVVPVPGPSAALTALSVSGLACDSFIFVGFLAKRPGKRQKELQELAAAPQTLIFYESPKRILRLLEEISAAMGNRYAVLCREMTKIHEEFVRGRLEAILHKIKERKELKGECTLLVAGLNEKVQPSIEAVHHEIRAAVQTSAMGLSRTAKAIAKKHGISKEFVYQAALAIKKKIAAQSKDNDRD